MNKIRNNNHKTYNNNKVYKHQFNKNKFINTIKCYQIKLILFKDVILKNQNDLLQLEMKFHNNHGLNARIK